MRESLLLFLCRMNLCKQEVGGGYEPPCTAVWRALTRPPSISGALVMSNTSLFPSSLVEGSMIERETERTQWKFLHLLFSSPFLRILIIEHQHPEDPWRNPVVGWFCRTQKARLFGWRLVKCLVMVWCVGGWSLPMGGDIISEEVLEI